MHHIKHGEFRESLTLSKIECCKVSFRGFQNIKNKELSLYKQALGLWNANMESDIDLVIDLKKNWFCDNET